MNERFCAPKTKGWVEAAHLQKVQAALAQLSKELGSSGATEQTAA
jgi:hypothetical protein